MSVTPEQKLRLLRDRTTDLATIVEHVVAEFTEEARDIEQLLELLVETRAAILNRNAQREEIAAVLSSALAKFAGREPQ